MNKIASLTPSWRLLSVAILGLTLAGCAANQPAPVTEGSSSAPQVAKPGYYIVRPGDTLLGISRRFNVSVGDLVSWNSISDPNQIDVGRELRVAVPGQQPVSGNGVVVKPITAPGVEVSPVTTPGAISAPKANGTYQTPQGGKQPYSEQALAAAKGSSPAASSPAAPATPPAAPAPESNWVWPASGKVIATFNDASSKGIDIAGKPGDPIVAADAGKVVYAGSGLRGYGKLVIIKHSSEFLTAYAHNRALLVKEGDSVSRGQKIAELGSTDADRPKLHFEVRRQGKPVDPLKYLPGR